MKHSLAHYVPIWFHMCFLVSHRVLVETPMAHLWFAVRNLIFDQLDAIVKSKSCQTRERCLLKAALMVVVVVDFHDT